jgi:uncharacterized membrane protein
MARVREKWTLERVVYSRFTVLLIMLFAMLVVLPLLSAEQHATTGMRWFFSLTMIAAVYAGSRRRRDLVIPLVLALPAGIGRWLPEFHHDSAVFITVTVMTILFLLMVTMTILNQVARARQVTFDTVSGALCCYLLAGFTWAFIFSLMQTVNFGAFSFPASTPAYFGPDLQRRSEFMKFVYYSFTTITTAGYGDIVPVSPAARSISIVEAIIGQFYIAVMIARLVSLEVTYSSRNRV